MPDCEGSKLFGDPDVKRGDDTVGGAFGTPTRRNPCPFDFRFHCSPESAHTKHNTPRFQEHPQLVFRLRHGGPTTLAAATGGGGGSTSISVLSMPESRVFKPFGASIRPNTAQTRQKNWVWLAQPPGLSNPPPRFGFCPQWPFFRTVRVAPPGCVLRAPSLKFRKLRQRSREYGSGTGTV